MRIDSETERLIEKGMNFGEYQTKEDLVTAALEEYIRHCRDQEDELLPRKGSRRKPRLRR